MRSGEELLRSGMVISVGKKEKNNNIIHVQALVLRTSGLNSKHPTIIKLWIDVSQEYGNRLVGDNEEEVTKVCDCPAGASEKCKHILAVMLYLSRTEEADLEDLSCTDIEKQWGTLKTTALKEYEAKSLSEMCHVKGQRDIYVKTMPEVTEEMESRWRMKLMQKSGLLVRPELPWLSASLDGTAMDKDGNFLRNIEIKTLKEGIRLTADELIEMNAIPILDKNQNLKKNTQHYTQMQVVTMVMVHIEVYIVVISVSLSQHALLPVQSLQCGLHLLWSSAFLTQERRPNKLKQTL
ncbi:hypothetical protein EVAR_82798_1 [Eumeta japonica]|uniref:SWIM-type domain-containing protein n=1 Tax=Eumeta variegata TaxID=151549 RepID=A0A4C1UN50_EUMVA|nr:hypothetical protein EVAR_82798_1 [Eumeta japonica]